MLLAMVAGGIIVATDLLSGVFSSQMIEKPANGGNRCCLVTGVCREPGGPGQRRFVFPLAGCACINPFWCRLGGVTVFCSLFGPELARSDGDFGTPEQRENIVDAK